MPRSDNPKDYLVVEDPDQPSTWHLQVSVNGVPDHRLMGAAWAALHEGFRGNRYEGPRKRDALRRLIRLYKQEKMPLPDARKSISDAPGLRGSAAQNCGNCRFARWVDGTDDLICQKFEFETEIDYLCDDWTEFAPSSPAVPVLPTEPNTAEPDEQKMIDLVMYGDAVKALGDGRIGGYLVRFGGQDLTGDWFAPTTDFGPHTTSVVLYHHGLDDALKQRVLDDDALLKRDEIGVWIEAQLMLRDQYEKAIYQLANAGKLGWSSGTAAHLVERDHKTGQILRWPLGLDASLTPMPAEPRNTAIPLKSLTISATLNLPEAAQENRSANDTPHVDLQSSINSGETTMNDEQFDALQGAVKALTDKVAALEETIKNAPPVSTVPAGSVTVISDPADQPFKTLAEQCAAIKAFEVSRGRTIHPRLTNPLLAVKATGASEGVPADGGFLLDPQLSAEVLMPVHQQGAFSRLINLMPTNRSYGWINGIDESSRATGSRWGGVRGYRLAEGGTLTASKPKFRRINWELKKYGVLVYGTDEMLNDAALFSRIVRQSASEELNFLLNDDILNGDGAAGPLGIAQSGAYVSVAKESGQAADTVVFGNLVKMWARLLPESKTSAATGWFVNPDVMPALDTLYLAAGTGGIPPRFVDYGADGVMRIKGKPVFETEFNATIGDQFDILLGDMSQYLVWEMAGVQEASSIHVQFLTDETVFRFIYRVDGQPAYASAITPYKGSNSLAPFVTLDPR